jgi:hypothetical protein
MRWDHGGLDIRADVRRLLPMTAEKNEIAGYV